MKDNFNFPRYVYDAIKLLPKSVQNEIYTAIMEYKFYGNEIEFKRPVAQSFFILLKSLLEIESENTFEEDVQETYKSSRKGVGGAPKGSKNNPKGRKGNIQELTETNSELTEELTETNSELTEELTETNSELTEELTETNSELTEELTETNSELTEELTETNSIFKKENEKKTEKEEKESLIKKKKKENKKEEEKEENPSPPYVVDGQKIEDEAAEGVRQEIEKLKTQGVWIDQVKLRYHILTDAELFRRLEDFALDCLCQGKQSHNSLADAKQHFFNWLRVKLQTEQKQKKDEQRDSAYRQTAAEAKQQRDEEFAEHIAQLLASAKGVGVP